MIRLYVYCEGQTEKHFVDLLLRDFLSSKGIETIPLIAGDCRNGRHGGITGYQQVKKELTRLCREHKNETVTTMVDLAPNFGKRVQMLWKESSRIDIVDGIPNRGRR